MSLELGYMLVSLGVYRPKKPPPLRWWEYVMAIRFLNLNFT